MIANSRCIACNLSKKDEKIRKHSDEKKKKEFIQKVTGILYKYGDIESTQMCIRDSLRQDGKTPWSFTPV